MEVHQVVERALTALLRGKITEHLAYCADDLRVEQVRAGQPQPSLHGKVAYAAFLAHGPLLEHQRGYDVLGPYTSAPQLFPLPCPQVSVPEEQTWTWLRAVLWVDVPAAVDGVPAQPWRQQSRLCIGVADGRIGVIEFVGGDAQVWRYPSQ